MKPYPCKQNPWPLEISCPKTAWLLGIIATSPKIIPKCQRKPRKNKGCNEIFIIEQEVQYPYLGKSPSTEPEV